MSTVWEGYGEDEGDGDRGSDSLATQASTTTSAAGPAATGQEELWEYSGTNDDGDGAPPYCSPQASPPLELEGLGADADLAAEPAHTNARQLRLRPRPSPSPAATAGPALATVAGAVPAPAAPSAPTTLFGQGWRKHGLSEGSRTADQHATLLAKQATVTWDANLV